MLNIWINVVGVLALYFSCINVLYESLNLRKKIYILIFVLASAIIVFPYIGQITTLFTLTGTLLMILNFTHHKLLNLCCALFGYIFCVCLNQPVLWIFQEIFSISIEDITLYPVLAASFSLLFCIFCYFSTKAMGWLFHKKLHISEVLEHRNLLIIVFITIVVFSLLFVFNFTFGEQVGYSYDIITFNCILFLGSFILVAILFFYIYRSILKEQTAKSKLKIYENLQDYTAELENRSQSMRKFKHDYLNILSTMTCYIEEGDLESLRTYFYGKILPIGHALSETDIKLAELSNIRQMEIKSIVSSKLIYSMESGIKTEIEILEPVEDFPMDIVDLSRILGVFLDNAIEAALLCEEKVLRFCIIKDTGHMIIVIQNTALPPEYPVCTLTELGVSSKGEHRGIGLYNVKNILDDYPSVLWDMSYQEPYFTQKLDFYSNKINDA